MAILEAGHTGPTGVCPAQGSVLGRREPQGGLGSVSDDPGVLAGAGLGGGERNRGAPGVDWRVIGGWNQWRVKSRSR